MVSGAFRAGDLGFEWATILRANSEIGDGGMHSSRSPRIARYST
jgi:hypothetical protein